MLTSPIADRYSLSNHIIARCFKPCQFLCPTTNIVGTLLTNDVQPVVRLLSKVRFVSISKHMPTYGSFHNLGAKWLLQDNLGAKWLLQVYGVLFLSALSHKLPKPVNSTPYTWICPLFSTTTSISRLSLNIAFRKLWEKKFYQDFTCIFKMLLSLINTYN